MKRWVLPLILVVSLALSTFFAVTVPFGANPDEVAHRDYIRLMIANRGFVHFVPPADVAASPASAPSPDDPPTPWETHQPPLYYLLCIPVQLASGGSVLAVRLVAAMLQLVTIIVVWAACLDLFPDQDALPIAVAGFVALLPLQAQLAGAINNDALTTLICAALFWRIARLAARDGGARDAVLIGCLIGVGLLTKTTVLELIPPMLLAGAVAVRASLLTARSAAAHCGVAIGMGLLIASPWLARNQLLYHDPLALSIYTKTGPNFTPDQIMQYSGWSTSDYLRNVGVRSFATFWYLLPSNLPFNRFVGPPLPLLVVLVLALGGALGAYRFGSRDTSGSEADRRVIGLFAAGAALLVPFFVRFIMTVFQAQGRYFLPGLLPIATITMLGWSTLLPGKGRYRPGVLVAIAALIGLLAMQVLGGV